MSCFWRAKDAHATVWYGAARGDRDRTLTRNEKAGDEDQDTRRIGKVHEIVSVDAVHRQLFDCNPAR